MAKKQTNEPVLRRVLLDDAKKDEMLAILVRNQQAFETVRGLLSVKHVRMISDGHALLWRTLGELYDKLGSLPARGSLLSQLHQALKDSPDILDQDAREELDTFLDYVYDDAEHGKDISKSKIHVSIAVETCKQYLEEYVALEIQASLLHDGMLPADIRGELDKKRVQLESVEALTTVELGQPFPDGWDTREHVKLFTTGVPVVDVLTGTGWRAGEVFLFMAPFGSCKTLLTCNAVANLVKECDRNYFQAMTSWRKRRKKAKLAGTKLPKRPKCPVVVLVFTEGSKSDYRIRILSSMATVPWAKLLSMKSMDDLSKSLKPQPYEEIEFHDSVDSDDGSFVPEYYRVQKEIKKANRHLVLIDCTDSDDTTAKIGRGGVREIAAVVNSYFRKETGSYPLAFFLDHASALADRVCEAMEGQVDDKAMRLTLKRIPRQCRDLLAVPWKAPVMIMHQLSGAANSRSCVAEMHHTDSAETKSIAEYVDFALLAGRPDHQQLVRFFNTKHRREPPTDTRIVRIDGMFNRLVDVSDAFFVDKGSQSFTPMEAKSTHEANAKIQKKAMDKINPLGMVDTGAQ